MRPFRLIASVAALITLGTCRGVLAPQSAAAQTGTIYVRATAAAPGNGTSWASAYPSLQTALQAAASGVEIWVAAGRYTPTSGGDRTISFVLKQGVAIYGGFGGTETARSQRNWAANVVTLSGDLYGNDGPNFANNGENSIHVVTGATGSTLDGVTISGGNANVDVPGKSAGGGMFNENGSPTLTNVTFSSNTALSGGGMFNFRSNPTLTNVTFSGNSRSGMYNNDSSPTLTNVTFSGNTGISGGGIYNANSSPTLTNVTFSDNSAISGFGGGMFNFRSNPTLTNVTFSGNNSSGSGGGMFNASSSPILTNVTFSGNSARNGDGGGMVNQGGAPFNQDSSPILTNVTFSGNNSSGSGGGMINENSSSPQIRNCIVWGNSAPSGPAIFNSSSTPTISYSLLEGGVPSGAVDGGNNLATNPLFVAPIDPASAPTTAGDLRLRAGSPAIDAGNNAVTSPTLPATDHDGNPRIVGGAVDMGAYERGIFTVNLPLVRR